MVLSRSSSRRSSGSSEIELIDDHPTYHELCHVFPEINKINHKEFDKVLKERKILAWGSARSFFVVIARMKEEILLL